MTMTRVTKEKAIKFFNTLLFFGKCDCPKEEIENYIKIAIQALEQINDIKGIINNPMYIQEDVLRYQMICEVVKE